MKKQYFTYYILLILLSNFLLAEQQNSAQFSSAQNLKSAEQDPEFEEDIAKLSTQWITVFVHGTFGLQANINIPTFIRLWNDEIECSSYVKQVECMRHDPAYYTIQPIQELGLKKIDDSLCAHRGPYLFSLMFNEILNKYRPGEQNNNYTFGWSGLVSVKNRYAESRIFYQALQKEIARIYQNNGTPPKVRLIGYSHGGSLCLNLAGIRSENSQDTFGIDELILIGAPVQTVTSSFIHDPIFKAIYNIYSAGDHVQRLDLFSYGNLLSHKKFHGNTCTPLPEKLRQVELKMTTQLCRSRNRNNWSPGHIELWFFGWTPSLYRRGFPLYPLPTAVFIPYIMQAVDSCPLTSTRRATLHLQPDLEQSLLETAASCSALRVPFMTKPELAILRQKALDLHPNMVIKRLRNNQKVPVLVNR